MNIESHDASATRAVASYATSDSAPDTDPNSAFWSGASRIIAEGDFYGNPIADHRTEILLRWTRSNFYVLFICPYQQLHLKPDPNLASETYEIWNYDVAEVFIGDDFTNIRHYKEFEVSPQGEWVDLDVNLDNPPHETGWVWQSGIQVAGKIDALRDTWNGFMRIPWSSITNTPPARGTQFRINFYRCQGRDPDRKYIAWQPVHRPSFHTPERFGILTLTAP